MLVAQERYGIWPHIMRISLYALMAVFAFYFFKPTIWVPNWFLGVGLIAAGLLSLFSKKTGCKACPGQQPLETVSRGDQGKESINTNGLKIHLAQDARARLITRPLVWFWGFLPCPMVLIMVSTSLALGSVVDVVVFMMCFGLGTLPALLSMSYGAHWFTKGLSFQKKWLQYGLIALGCWSLYFGVIMSNTHEMHTHESHDHSSLLLPNKSVALMLFDRL